MTAPLLLREGWRWVRFGDVVHEVRKTTNDPGAEGLTRVVGLEHLDSESLPINRWHELMDMSDGTSFTRVFRAGQVLFGKRRAYQRKVGVPDFDGICSSDVLVFEPKSSDLLPEFLPYIVQSDGFFGHALGTSAGSLSPRTKWQELAKYEFALPPHLAQVHIVGLLRATTALRSELDVCAAAAQRSRDAAISGASSEATEESLGSVLVACDYGLSLPPQNAGDLSILRMNNLNGDELKLDDLRWVKASAVADSDLVRPDDILFNRTNSVEHVGKVALVPPDIEPMAFASYLIRLRVDVSRVLPAFVTGFLQSSLGKARIRQHVTLGVSQANVNSTNLKKIRIPVPSLDAQVRIVDEWQRARRLQAAIHRHDAATHRLAGGLREDLLRGVV